MPDATAEFNADCCITLYHVYHTRYKRYNRNMVADTLFVIADDYASPVRYREDLVRHGYLRADN